MTATCPPIDPTRNPEPWLDLARVAAVAAVVLLHVSAYGVTGTPVGSGDWWVANLADSAVRWCVPVLVMVSGALLLHPARRTEPPALSFANGFSACCCHCSSGR